MTVCTIYSGWLRTWEQCQRNHYDMLRPSPSCVIHYNELTADLMPEKREDWEHYRANKAPETEPENTISMWRGMWRAWRMAPTGFDCYVRNRYDIVFDGQINFENFALDDNKVYIPQGQDYREGVNDQFAFGSYAAMEQYYCVYLDHAIHFEEGKMFHSESYLKYSLDRRGIKIMRVPVTNRIIRP